MSLLGICLIAIHIILVVSLPDDNLSITQFIAKHNYPVETHKYVTSDGYTLTAHRIPHGVASKEPKNVILLAHGMGGSAENYILLGPPDALAFYMADRGYDVWLFNARGTVHSRKHRSLDPNRDRKKFWDFSWNEIAMFDLPATINYVLNATGAEKLFYVGHSQGTTSFFAMLSELPEMNDKIKAAAMLAPSVRLEFTSSAFISLLVRFLGIGQRITSLLNWHEVPIPNSPMLNRILVVLCRSEALQDMCMDIIYIIGGTESGLVNKTMLPIILQYSPSGFALRQVWHYAQIIKTGEFKKYDYGAKKNIRLYNDTKPPYYKLSNARVPLALFYASADPFGNVRMIEELSKSLPNIILKYLVPVEDFNHLDYIMAYNAKQMIYDPLLMSFKPYED